MKACASAWKEGREDVIEMLVYLTNGPLDVFLTLSIEDSDCLLELFFVLLDDLSLTDELLMALAVHVEQRLN